MGPLLDSFQRQLRDQPAGLALIDGEAGASFSFEQLAERVHGWAPWVDETRGLPTAVATGNRSSFVELFLALRMAGSPVVSMDASEPLERKLAACRRLGITRLLHSSKPNKVKSANVVSRAWPHGVCCTELSSVDVAELPSDTALVKLTSGSTGEAVGACFSEYSLDVGIRQIAGAMKIRQNDRVLMAIPLSHSYGFDNGVLSLVVLGTPLVLERTIYPAGMLRALAQHEITVLPLVPPLVRSLGGTAWPRDLPLRLIICAGGALQVEAAHELHGAAGLPVHNFFGSTETGGISFEPRPLNEDADGTVGFPLPGVDITLDDEQRVRVVSEANTIGYVGQKGSGTAREISTGDLATWTPQGRLRLIGRTAEVLNVGGKKVVAAEIERALATLHGILQAAVVGVEDPIRGERAVAFLVTEHWPVDLSKLPSPLVPREVRRVERLPFNERGKLDRAVLRRQATR